MIDIVIPLRIESVANLREHWAKRANRAKQHRTLAWAELRAVDPGRKLLGKVCVTLTRIAPRALDDDNLRASLKHVRDGVADWLGVDDRSPLVEWRYGQAKAGVRQYAVRIQVEADHG